MGPAILGWVLIVVGLLALVAGVGGGIAMMFKEIQRKAGAAKSFALTALPTDLIKALVEFVKALTAAPVWLALIVIGVVLIAWGGSMI